MFERTVSPEDRSGFERSGGAVQGKLVAERI